MTVQRDTLLCSYHYEPLDRIASCVPLNQQSIQRFYRKDRLTTETQGPVQHSVFEHDAQLLAQQQRQLGKVDSALLATDLQRSVLHLVSVDHHQQPVYTTYGHRFPEGGLISLMGFNGERRDPVTGHYLLGNGYRAFNPVLMRFNSPDNLSPFGKGGVNAYAYGVGDPVNRVDPSGHSPWLVYFQKYLPQVAANVPANAVGRSASLSSIAGNVGANVSQTNNGASNASMVTTASGRKNINSSAFEALDLANTDQLPSIKEVALLQDLDHLNQLFEVKSGTETLFQATGRGLATLERFVSSKRLNPAEIPAQPAFKNHAKARLLSSMAKSELEEAVKVFTRKHPEITESLAALGHMIRHKTSG